MQMTDTRRKAQAMLNDARDAHVNPDDYLVGYTALCRAIEQHEAFRQEVSDALVIYSPENRNPALGRFIIAKPDPLADAVESVLSGFEGRKHAESYANQIRAALEARGLEIREKAT